MNMVERVAEAMWKAYHASEGHRTASDGISWQTIRENATKNEGARLFYAMGIAEARAALAAMKYEDGTDETLFVKEAIAEKIDPVAFICAHDRMIHAALSEPEGVKE